MRAMGLPWLSSQWDYSARRICEHPTQINGSQNMRSGQTSCRLVAEHIIFQQSKTAMKNEKCCDNITSTTPCIQA